MFKGKEKKKCVRLEVICVDLRYISHINSGSPGARNDLNILNSSDHFNRIRTSRWPLRGRTNDRDPAVDMVLLPCRRYLPTVAHIHHVYHQPAHRQGSGVFQTTEGGAEGSLARIRRDISAVSDPVPSLPIVAYEIHAK
jgi:hypothetical protein